MHWLTQPGTSVTEETGSRSRPARTCGRSRACATAGRTSARRSWPTRSTAWTSARTGSASTRTSTTTRRWRTVHETVEDYPGLYRDVQTYLRERIKEVLTGTSESIVVRIYGPDLATLRDPGGARSRSGSPTSRASSTRTPRCRPTCRTSRSNRTWPRREPYGLTPGDIRRQSSTHDRQRGGQRHLRRRSRLRRARDGHPAPPATA